MNTKNKITKAIIPAAGLGLRFLPYTKTVPKEMLPILNVPSIHYIIQEAIDSGITEIIIITSSTKQALVDYCDRNIALENELIYKKKSNLLNLVRGFYDKCNFIFLRQYEPKGLGHAILQAKNLIGNDSFAILLGDDVIYNPKEPALKQLINLYEKFDASIVGVQKVPINEVINYGIVDLEKELEINTWEVKGLIEKPSVEETPSNLSIMGRYILKPEIFKFLEEKNVDVKTNEIQLTDSILKLLNLGKVIAYNFEGKRYDMGSIIGFLEAQIEFAMRNPLLRNKVIDLVKKEMK